MVPHVSQHTTSLTRRPICPWCGHPAHQRDCARLGPERCLPVTINGEVCLIRGQWPCVCQPERGGDDRRELIMSDQGEEPQDTHASQSGITTNGDVTYRGPGHISGNLTRDPELRFTPNGRVVCHIRVAETQRERDPRTGEWQDSPTVFRNVTGWGKLAENMAEALRKGDRVVAVGRVQSRSYTNTDGALVEYTELVARDLGPSMLFRAAYPFPPTGGGASS